MRQNSDVRVYEISVTETPANNTVTIKGLAVKEKEIVVSHIFLGDETNAIRSRIETRQAENGQSFPCKIGEQINEDDLVAYFQDLSEDEYTMKDVYNDVEFFSEPA
jgi:hypothetical protein